MGAARQECFATAGPRSRTGTTPAMLGDRRPTIRRLGGYGAGDAELVGHRLLEITGPPIAYASFRPSGDGATAETRGSELDASETGSRLPVVASSCHSSSVALFWLRLGRAPLLAVNPSAPSARNRASIRRAPG